MTLSLGEALSGPILRACTLPRVLAATYFFFAAAVVLWIGLNTTPPFSRARRIRPFVSRRCAVLRPDPWRTRARSKDRRRGRLCTLDLSVALSRTAGRAVPMPTDASSAARQMAWSGMSAFKAYPNTGQYGPMLYLPKQSASPSGVGSVSPCSTLTTSRASSAGVATLGIAALAIASAAGMPSSSSCCCRPPCSCFLRRRCRRMGCLSQCRPSSRYRPQDRHRPSHPSETGLCGRARC